MHTQQTVTIIGSLPDGLANTMVPAITMYPELNSLLNHGMYIDSFRQKQISPGRYLLTFNFRYNVAELT